MGERACACGCGRFFLLSKYRPGRKYYEKACQKRTLEYEAWQRDYVRRPEVKARSRERSQTTERKVYRQVYHKSYCKKPEVKAKLLARGQTPEAKARMKAWREKKKEAARLAKEEQQVAGVVEAIRDGLRRPDLLPLFCDGIHEVMLVKRVVEEETKKLNKLHSR